jgi:hypothetical protein
VAAVLVACHQDVATRDTPVLATRAEPNPSATASASAPASAAVLPSRPDACAAFRARTKAALAALADASSAAPTLVGFCAATPHGAWRIEMPDAATMAKWGDDYAIEARFSIVHVGLDGHREVYVPPDGLSDYGVRQPETPVLFDFDGDGEPEIYVAVREQGDEGHRALQNDLLTFDGHTVKRYAPASGYAIDAVRDVDGDGRPDLAIFAKYTDTLEGCWAGFPYDWPDAKFVAHSLPDGTFSTDDAAARAHARKWCASPPTKIGSSYDAICARLWASTPFEVVKARKLVASCVPDWCAREHAHAPQPAGAAEDCERRVSWFDEPPPFTLP